MNIYLTKSLKNKKRKKDYCDQIGKMGKTGQKKITICQNVFELTVVLQIKIKLFTDINC